MLGVLRQQDAGPSLAGTRPAGAGSTALAGMRMQPCSQA